MSLDTVLMIIRIMVAAMFLIDLLKLLKRDKQDEVIVSMRTTVLQELYYNCASISSFMTAYVLFTLFDIYKLDGGFLEIAMDILIVSLMAIYFLLPKRIVIGNIGVFKEGTLDHWNNFVKVGMRKNVVILRRDRYLLPPIKIPSDRAQTIYDYAVTRIQPNRSPSGLRFREHSHKCKTHNCDNINEKK
ncbi:MAG: hypothetical protein QF682_06540 [Candidatus Thermoplasmatota archaeon]|jgi:hypothetical protein|nr:hypothetical protein [Candidatus Thermoplasmatota archaeon]